VEISGFDHEFLRVDQTVIAGSAQEGGEFEESPEVGRVIVRE